MDREFVDAGTASEMHFCCTVLREISSVLTVQVRRIDVTADTGCVTVQLGVHTLTELHNDFLGARETTRAGIAVVRVVRR